MAFAMSTRSKGMTLIEMLCALAVISILAVAIAVNTVGANRKVNQLKVSSYLMQLQAMQARHWLQTGAYLPLSALPIFEIKGVSVEENKSTNNEYEIKVVMSWLSTSHVCKTQTLTEQGITPQMC